MLAVIEVAGFVRTALLLSALLLPTAVVQAKETLLLLLVLLVVVVVSCSRYCWLMRRSSLTGFRKGVAR